MSFFSHIDSLPSLEKTFSKNSSDSGKSGLSAAAFKVVTFSSSPTSDIDEVSVPVSPTISAIPTPAAGPVGDKLYTIFTATEQPSSIADVPVSTSHSYYKQDWKALGAGTQKPGPINMPTLDAAKMSGEEQAISANDTGKTKAETDQWIAARASKPECFNTTADVHAFINAGVVRLPPIVLRLKKVKKQKKSFLARATAFMRPLPNSEAFI